VKWSRRDYLVVEKERSSKEMELILMCLWDLVARTSLLVEVVLNG